MSTHVCSNSSNISSNWHCINMLVCSCMVANVAGAHSVPRSHCSLKLLLVVILVLNLAHKLHRSFMTMFFLPLSSMSQSSPVTQTLPIHISLPFLVCSICYIPFLGLWGQRITRTLGSFHAALAINALLQLTT